MPLCPAQDKALLAQLKSNGDSALVHSAGGPDNAAAEPRCSSDKAAAMAAAVRFRLERKLVWEAAERALSAFLAFTSALGEEAATGTAGAGGGASDGGSTAGGHSAARAAAVAAHSGA